MPEISKTQNVVVGAVVYGFWGLAILGSTVAAGARQLIGRPRVVKPVSWGN